MVRIFYSQLDWIDNDQFLRYMKLMPEKIQRDIGKYVKVEDRKARLLGKLMLLQALRSDNKEFLLAHMYVKENQKPEIKEWYQFNISHSGNFVIFGYSEKPIGIDIECHSEEIISTVTNWLHPDELNQIRSVANKRKFFFDIWTKKEALLKNIGTGLVNNLDEINCLNNQIEYGSQKFYFHPLNFNSGYSAYICYAMPKPDIAITEFRPDII